MHGLEFYHVKAVREDAVRLPLEKVLGLVCGDMRDGRENVRTMRRGSFNTVAMVDATLPSFVVDIEIL